MFSRSRLGSGQQQRVRRRNGLTGFLALLQKGAKSGETVHLGAHATHSQVPNKQPWEEASADDRPPDPRQSTKTNAVHSPESRYHKLPGGVRLSEIESDSFDSVAVGP